MARDILRERGTLTDAIPLDKYTDSLRIVDLHLNPGNSKLEAKWSKEASKKAAQARKRRRKERQKAQEKEDGIATSTDTKEEIAKPDEVTKDM